LLTNSTRSSGATKNVAAAAVVHDREEGELSSEGEGNEGGSTVGGDASALRSKQIKGVCNLLSFLFVFAPRS